ncbi:MULTISPECIES: helix-turn-helix domain-containing protein [Bacillus]|uniref:AraC-like DNA-binding protein n=1 Tax=Bacillus capparidis TaxID=1840411 RepID=A0ABS4CXT9_9BACI|nr:MULTISPECIES: AraC family transcriptional regulator [Bacillus]MBP1082179.1 AraC-like DNA-binding protein [Bacillus capparidis]MED1096793.1 AraC family transcriptional regulator [Bacillus capparidis]
MGLRDSQCQVLWVSRIDYSKNSGVKQHSHDFFQLLLVIDGEGLIEIGNEKYNVLANRCYIFKQGYNHSFYFTKNTITIDFKFTLSKDIIQFIQENNVINIYQMKDITPFKELFKLSILKLDDANALLPFRIDVGFKSALLGILQENLSQYVENTINVPLINTDKGYPMVQYLEKHMHTKMSLEEMADYFGFHPHYLIELFKKNTGTTPMQYLQALRLDKAKEYLEFTTHTISEIADFIGLTAPYFSRLCCDRFGKSPTKLREQMRKVVGKDIVLEQDFTLDTQPLISNKTPI